MDDKPTIPDAQIQSDWNQTTTTAKDYIKNKPTIPAAQVNSDWNASSGVAKILNKPTIPDISTKVSKTGDTMSGTLQLPMNTVASVRWREPNETWECYTAYETDGDEALVFASKNAKTSFMFVNGEAEANVARDRWRSLTPALQIKNGKVIIGKLIGTNVTPAYQCEVNGISYTKGLVVEGYADGGTGDYEGILVKPATNGWAGVILGNGGGRRAIFYLPNEGAPHIKYSPDGISAYRANFQAKNGTIALKSDIPSSLPANGGTADYVKYTHTNEINFKGGKQTTCYFNYRNADTDATDPVEAIVYQFCNYSSSTAKTTIVANKFSGTATNASTLDGASATSGITGDTIVKRNAAGYIHNVGYYAYYGNTASSSWTCSSDTATISELRGNGFCIRADSGLWVRPTGTGLTFKPVNASAFTVGSSRRYKENIEPLSEEEAKKILDIETVTFDYKDKEGADDRSVYNQRGVIAEQVEDIIPFVVTLEKVDDVYVPGRVDYSKFTPYLIKMCQIQQEEINSLKEEVSELKKLIQNS